MNFLAMRKLAFTFCSRWSNRGTKQLLQFALVGQVGSDLIITEERMVTKSKLPTLAPKCHEQFRKSSESERSV